MTRRRKRILVALGIAGAVAAAIWTGAVAVLPPWLRATAERITTQALGRDLKIAGPIDVSLSLAPRVTVGDVRLANAPWGSEPSMVQVGRVTIVVDLVSLWSGPVRVRELEIDDAHLLLESDGAGRGNWVLSPQPASQWSPEEGPPVVLEQAAIRGLELVFRPRPEADPVKLGVRRLEARLDPATGKIDVRGGGQLNEAPWEISGRLGTLEKLYRGRDVDLALAARVGEARLEIRGRVHDPLVLGGPELEVSVDAPDVVAAQRIFRLWSPLTGAFHLQGRLTSAKDGVDAEVSGSVGEITAKAHGVVDARLSRGVFHATLEAAGPDASLVGSWFGVQGLPPRAFDLAARMRREDGRLHLEGVKARVGATALALAGVLGAGPRFVGTDLTARATGQDLSALSRLTRVRLPRGPFRASGRLIRRADGLAIEAAEVRFRGAVIRAEGTLGEPPRLSNLKLKVDASGPDLAVFSRLATVELPQAPFALRGSVARDGQALILDAAEGRLGDDTASVGGRVVLAKRLEGTDVRVRAAGPDLSKLASIARLRGAPARPFDVGGRVRIVPGGYELDGVHGSVGSMSAAVEGHIGALAALDGTSLTCRIQGPALSDLAAWGLPGVLPADPFSVAGRLRIEDGAYHVDGVVAKVGPDRAVVDGLLGVLPDVSRLDAAVEAAGPSLAGLGRFLAAAGLEMPEWVPAVGYEISGRVRRVPSGYDIREARANVGEAMVRVKGTVGAGKAMAGTELRIEASGPHLGAMLGPGSWASSVPAAAFEVSSDLAGSLERLAVRRLAARLGGSDLEGSLSMGLVGKLVIDADLRSRRLDVTELLGGPVAAPAATPAAPAKQPGDERLLSDDPLELPALHSLDATLRLEVAELSIPGVPLRDVVVDGQLRDGALRVDRVEGSGVHGGRATADLALEPAGRGYRLATRGRLDGGRFVARSAGMAPEKAPSLDVEFQLRGEGRSLRDIAASLDGLALVVLGPGQISSAQERMTSDVLRGLLEALNPFRRSSGYTEFECGIAAATAEQGKVAIEPIAARTDKTTVVGRGKVDFRTEAIDLEWTIKPRTGVGISPGSIANPYVKLGGTLSSPRLEVKPLEAVASTGAAVATLGLTVLAKGLYDRVTATKNVCVDALVKARAVVPKEP